ncbi:MAG: phospholipase [Marinilabiliales bacterium]|nr:MAG: phospholipase [Marinilabiliales bacterium]
MHSYDIRERGNLQTASKALILLHGRGATAENIMPLADFFTNESWYVAAPQATNYQWYPYSFLMPAEQNEPWLSSAIDYVKKIIDNISGHIPSENIYIMGFSQGACLSAEVAARNAAKYGGLGIFTGGVIGEEPAWELYRGDFKSTPVYISNGDNDPHIPQSRSEESRDQLQGMGARVTLDIFPGREHTILQEEIDRAKELLSLH